MNIAKSIYVTLFKTYTRTDLTPWEHEPQIKKKIYGFYHIYCYGRWQDLVSKQLNSLQSSGLMGVTDCLYVSIITLKEGDMDDFKKLTSGMNVKVVSHATDGRLYEYPALEALWNKAYEEDCYLYYFHTKGVSFHTAKGKNRTFRHFKRNVDAWREMMEYFLMYKWKVAVNVLNAGYDTYGCYRYPPKPAKFAMYGGNFWWASSSYVKKLHKIDVKSMSADRMYAELWLYTGDLKDFSPFDNLAILYRVNIPKSLYTQPNPPLLDRLRFILRFNYTKAMKKILKYDYTNKQNKSFQDQ